MSGMTIDLGRPSGVALALLPELVLTTWALVLMVAIAWRHRDERDQWVAGVIALFGLVSTLGVVIWYWVNDVGAAGPIGMIALDPFRYATDIVFLLGAVLAVGLALGYLGPERIVVPEYYLLVVLATLGMMFMGGGADLIVIFLGLELMSISVYVLAGIDRRSVFAAEAALKYFLLGAFASGFFLYGVALTYGATGTTNLVLVHARIVALGVGGSPMLLIGVGLLLIGFGFKVAAVPFHMWAPDVYDGAPTPVTAFMAAAVKAAGFAALVRVLLQGFEPATAVWSEAVWWLAVATMIVGNLVALSQRQLKRMLAYSSIGHAGYLLVAVASGTTVGVSAFLFYAFAYTLMTVGAFAILSTVGERSGRELRIEDLAGLAARRPGIAFATAVFMLSLLGFPGTAGFIGKWFILSAAVDAARTSLAVVLVGASVVSAGYYLPVIMAMYMKPPLTEDAHGTMQLVGGARWIVVLTTVSLLVFGLWPNRVLDLAEQGASTLNPDIGVVVSQ